MRFIYKYIFTWKDKSILTFVLEQILRSKNLCTECYAILSTWQFISKYFLYMSKVRRIKEIFLKREALYSWLYHWTPCLTGLDLSVLQIKTKIVSCHTADYKTVKQEVKGTVTFPLLVVIPARTNLRGREDVRIPKACVWLFLDGQLLALERV